MAQDIWLWAAQRLWRRAPLVLASVLATALLYATADARAEVYLLLVIAIALLVAIIELCFVADALARRGAAPGTLWRGRLLFGFFWRWSVLLAFFVLLPITATTVVLLSAGSPYPDLVAGRVLTVIETGFWWAGYALMGTMLPAFLSGRPGGMGDAIRRPGFRRRLRALTPAVLVQLAASLAFNELIDSEASPVGGLTGSLFVDAALITAATHLPMVYATALGSRALADDLIDDERLGDETVQAFE